MATATKRQSLKEEVRELIGQLPDTCSMEDIHYQLYLIEKIRRGEEALKNKGGIPHQEVRKRLAKWRAN
jgi:hypothetical protein